MRALAILALLLVAGSAEGAVTVKAAIDPARVTAGESAELVVTVEGSQSASQPTIANTAGLGVSYRGPTQQMSIVNGRFSASVAFRFTVVGSKAGRFALGPITTEVDGARYDAGTVTLEVTAPAPDAGAASGPAGEDVVLQLSLPRSAVYVRERIPVTLKLSIATRVTDLQYPILAADGVAIEKFPEPVQRREETADGMRQVVEFKTTLTPLKTGRITLGPAEMPMSLVVSRRSRGFFDGFFDSERRPIQVRSNPVTLDVLPLPTEGRPADFSGAVGTFTFTVTAAPLDLAVGDPVTVRSAVRGEGSLDGLAAPSFVASDKLRVYPPQASPPVEGETGRTFEQVVIPLKEGAVTVPAPRFSYFDSTARAYRTITPPPIALTVRPSAHAKAAPEIVGGPVPAPDAVARPETLGRDIVFIKETPGRLRPIGFRWYRAPWWWALQLLPPLVWLAATVRGRRQRLLAGDVRYARFAHAERAARTAFGRVRAALAAGDVAPGHDAVAAALRDYLAAKLDLPPGAVADAAPARLRTNGLDPEVGARVGRFFAGCEAARFTPAGSSRAAVELALADAEGIVKALERARGLAPTGLGLVAGLVLVAASAIAAGEGPSALFFRANGLYAGEQWKAAAESYERVLAAGVESAAVHFNLGNAHYKQLDVGRAVIAYERARRLAPGDPDLHANLRFAREMAGDPDPEPGLERYLAPFAARASTDALAWTAAGAWWLGWLAAALAALVPAVARGARAAVVIAAVAGVLATSSGAYAWWSRDHPTFAVVVDRETTVRAEPTANATPLFSAKPGTVLRIERTREGAALVEARDGRRGWIDAAAVGPI